MGTNNIKKAKIIVLAGQSNAVGVGHVPCLDKHFPPEKVAEFTRGYPNIPISYCSHGLISEGFVPTALRGSELGRNTFGPEVGMAEALTEKAPREPFYLVKCAYGGTNLYHNWRSDTASESTDPETPGWCYTTLVGLLAESIRLLREKGLEPEITAFCWMQGESDTGSDDCVLGYIPLFEKLLQDFRAKFRDVLAPSFTVVDAGISQIWPRYERLNQLKKGYAQKCGHLYLDTIAAGLTTRNEPEEDPDVYHYDSDSVIRLGRMFINAIL